MVVPGPVPAPAPSPSTLAPSLIRTLFPMVAGALANWLLQKLGLYDVDSTLAVGLVSAGLGWVYYAGARFLEVYGSDKWGYILGFRRQPVYQTGTTPADPPPAAPKRRAGRGAADVDGAAVAVIIGSLIALVLGYTLPSGVLVAVGWVALVVGVGLYLLAAIGSRRR